MARPTIKLTNDEALRLHDMEWVVPDFAVEAIRKKDGKTIHRWNEVAVISGFYIDEKEDGSIKGQIRFVISDQDIHQPTNPRKPLQIWLNLNPDMMKLPKSDIPKDDSDPRWGDFWSTKLGIQKIEETLKAIGETGILVQRKYVNDLGALYDLLEQNDFTGREVMLHLETPPRYEKATDPDIRYVSGL